VDEISRSLKDLLSVINFFKDNGVSVQIESTREGCVRYERASSKKRNQQRV